MVSLIDAHRYKLRDSTYVDGIRDVEERRGRTRAYPEWVCIRKHVYHGHKRGEDETGTREDH